ncbi:MAG: DNA internalization-related competence protein ComEC/Rec2 [Candidatus Thiodiazotropha sp. (ex Rostrolucina anterorostrata)]|nr:DNA internalization-related competence protein ComEC/Rec2 [Candidatus Thiodiazotropha sp. (ex Rostrolucina anterorostrata)]
MNGILICFVVGATLFHFFRDLQGLGWLTLLVPMIVLWRYKWSRPLSALLAGAGWSLLFATYMLQQQLPADMEREDLVLKGVVESLPARQGRLSRFKVRVNELLDARGIPLDLSHLQLSWFGTKETVRVGDTWQLKVRLKRPRGMQNPAGFDYERWLFSQRVQAKGYVRAWSGNRVLSTEPGTAWMDRLRQTIARLIDQHTAQPVAAALLKALSVGDKRGIGPAEWRVFSLTGTNHLIAISGLHVGIVAGWVLLLGQWGWCRSERLTLKFPALKAGAIMALIGALIYAGLAGFSLPTQRALLMLLTTLGGVVLGRRIQPARSLVLALFLVVLLDPVATLSAGFWLSFGAVAVIMWSVGGRIVPWQGWRQGVRVQWFVTLGLLPILLLFFGRASLVSPVVNLIMVPWFTLVLVPLVLAGLPLLLIPAAAGWWFWLLGLISGYTYQFLVWFSSLPFALMELPDVTNWLWGAAIVGSLLWMMPGGMPGRALGVWLFVPIFLSPPERPHEGDLWFTLLDVGQGLACVIETSDHLLIYDTGPANDSGFSTAETVLLPFLRAQGYDKIDRLLLSNGDRDHAGGYSWLKEALPIGDVLAGEPERTQYADACLAGESWSWDGVTFKLLHPQAKDSFQRSNDRSCVLLITLGDWRILLPGDIEKVGEKHLLERYPDALKSQILVAPHHGSATSSTAPFVTAIDPEWVLFSTGYKNSYGFPKDEVVQRWQARGAVILNTAETGAIQLRLSPYQTELKPRLYRELNKRYWSDRNNEKETGG